MSDLWLSSPLTVLAAIAARTSRIRIGTYILLLSLHDPFRIAEDISTVDILSHGRLDIGIGAAPEKEETDIWGIAKPETYERTYEALKLIERFFTEKEVTHHGKYYDYDSVTMSPQPVQKPGPPFWIAAQGPKSAARAARRGYYSAAGAGRAHDEYVKAWQDSGRDLADMRIVSVPLVFIVRCFGQPVEYRRFSAFDEGWLRSIQPVAEVRQGLRDYVEQWLAECLRLGSRPLQPQHPWPSSLRQ